jgi:hypothetical protein
MAPPPPRPEQSPSLVTRALTAARAKRAVTPREGADPSSAPAQAGSQDDGGQRPRHSAPASAGTSDWVETPATTPGGTPAKAGVQGVRAPSSLWVPAAVEAEGDARKTNSGHRWRAALVLLIAAGPALTWAGATILDHRARAEIAALSPAAEPVLVAARADAATRAVWAPLLGGQTLGTTLDRFAATLPADDRLASIASDGDGTIDATVLTADPDALRDALRREPVLSQLRETGQQRGDAVMRVALRGRPQ